MDKSDFAVILEQKQEDIQKKIRDEKVALGSPKYHVERIANQLRQAVGGVNPAVEQSQIVEELMKIINQVPTWIAVGFSQKAHIIARHQQDLSVWNEASEEYDSMIEHQRLTAKREQEVLEAVGAGELEERNTRTRRDIGEHPGPTTREIRKAKAKLRQSSS